MIDPEAVRRALLTSLALLALAAAGCGGAGSSSGAGIGSSHAPRGPRALELTLRTPDGRVIELADQRGSPVLLFFFATYDGASLASQRDLGRFTRDALDTVVIAVALQPDAPTFTEAFVASESPPYTVAFDPDDVVLRGLSDLGQLDEIPTFVMIDAHGREVARHTGYVSERRLHEWHREALERGGVTTAP